MTGMKRWLTVWSGLAFFASNLPARGPVTEQNVVVYKAAGRYGGWPANHGIWSWGNEILVGFEAGYFKFSDTRHSIDFDRPAEHLLARSLDGGETWTVEKHPELRAPDGVRMAGVATEPGGKAAIDCPGGVDFSNPNFALTARQADKDVGPSRFCYSMDRRPGAGAGRSSFPTSDRKALLRGPTT